MACGCIKKDFDIYVTYTDCKHIVIEDQSRWMEDAGYTRPESLTMKIRLESRGKEITQEIFTNKRNILNSIDLLGTTEEQCLSDDIYCFTVDSCGLTYSVSRAYLCNTLCKIDQLTAKAKDAIDYENIRLLRSLAEAVEINTKIGKVQAASELLKDLTRRLAHLTCDHCK